MPWPKASDSPQPYAMIVMKRIQKLAVWGSPPLNPPTYMNHTMTALGMTCMVPIQLKTQKAVRDRLKASAGTPSKASRAHITHTHTLPTHTHYTCSVVLMQASARSAPLAPNFPFVQAVYIRPKGKFATARLNCEATPMTTSCEFGCVRSGANELAYSGNM